MHKINCMQCIENISTWEVFNSICPLAVLVGWLVGCSVPPVTYRRTVD